MGIKGIRLLVAALAVAWIWAPAAAALDSSPYAGELFFGPGKVKGAEVLMAVFRDHAPPVTYCLFIVNDASSKKGRIEVELGVLHPDDTEEGAEVEGAYDRSEAINTFLGCAISPLPLESGSIVGASVKIRNSKKLKRDQFGQIQLAVFPGDLAPAVEQLRRRHAHLASVPRPEPAAMRPVAGGVE